MVNSIVGAPDRALKDRAVYPRARTAAVATRVRAIAGALAAVPSGAAVNVAWSIVFVCLVMTGSFLASLATASAAVAHVSATGASRTTDHAVAWAAQSLVANDQGNLHLVGESGESLVEEGQMAGTFPGRAKLWFSIGTTVSATFTLYPSAGGGTVSGHGTGKLRSSGRYASFGGTMSISSGTGRYRHAHGSGGFYGTILRRSPYPVVVQTRGTLFY